MHTLNSERNINFYIFISFIIITISLISGKLSAQDFGLPEKLLNQNLPNAADLMSSVQYMITSSRLVQFKIYNKSGWEVKTVVDAVQQKGSYIIHLNTLNLAAGVYFYKIAAGNIQDIKKIFIN